MVRTFCLKNPSPAIINVSKVNMLRFSLRKGMFLLQGVSRYRCLGYLTLQEGIYIPDVDPHSDYTYLHIGITCHILDYFTGAA